MNSLTLEKTLKITSGLLVAIMVFFALGVLLGLTAFYVGPISVLRYASFWAIVVLPIIAVASIKLIGFVRSSARVTFIVSLALFIADFSLIQFANGRW
jgi:hypothetical protein